MKRKVLATVMALGLLGGTASVALAHEGRVDNPGVGQSACEFAKIAKFQHVLREGLVDLKRGNVEGRADIRSVVRRLPNIEKLEDSCTTSNE